MEFLCFWPLGEEKNNKHCTVHKLTDHPVSSLTYYTLCVCVCVCVCVEEVGGERERVEKTVWVFMANINLIANVYYCEQIRNLELG